MPRLNPPLTPDDMKAVLRCIQGLAERSGLTPYECLSLLEEVGGPLRPADHAQIVAALKAAEPLREKVH